MINRTRVLLLCGALSLWLAIPGRADFDVETYIEISIARLELIVAAWQETGGPPAEGELEDLYASYGTDRETYLCAAGEMGDQIESYLRRNPQLQETIDSLAASIRQHIAEGEEE